MTRRKIYFYNEIDKKIYSTPEFNGDRDEFIMFRKHEDSCDKNFDEILQEFIGVKTLEEFEKASDKAQSYYHSFLGDSILPINEVKENEKQYKIYMIYDGELYLYNPETIDRNYLLNVCDKGNFIYRDLPMYVTKYNSKVLNGNIYTLNIYPIENVSKGSHITLGKLEDYEISDTFDVKLNKYINKIQSLKEILNKDPIKLELINSPNSNYSIAFRNEENNIYVLDDARDGFFLIKLDSKSFEPEYNLKSPIEFKGKVITPEYSQWYNSMIFDSHSLDIPALKIASELNSYMTILEDIYSQDTINKNLNEILEDIYNEENINKYYFEKYKNEDYISELKKKYYIFLIGAENTNMISTEENEEECNEPTS